MNTTDERIIELRELRIGNLLEYKGELVYVTLLDMDVDDEGQETIGFCEYGKSNNEHLDWNRVLAKDLIRIPIIDQWLRRFGFKANDQNWDGPTFDYWFGIEYFSIMDCGSGLYRLMGSEWPMGKPFRYVHQLQNLFYYQAGEELTIKQNV